MLSVKDPVQQLMRHLVLAHQLQLLCAIFCDDSHKVRVRSESGSGCAQAVRHDHVHVLFRKLCPGIFQHILGFHGKAAKHLSLSPVGSKPCQNIIGAFQFKLNLGILTLLLGLLLLFLLLLLLSIIVD